jgi:hypothetical protein
MICKKNQFQDGQLQNSTFIHNFLNIINNTGMGNRWWYKYVMKGVVKISEKSYNDLSLRLVKSVIFLDHDKN